MEFIGVNASPGFALGTCIVLDTPAHEDYQTQKIESSKVDYEMGRIDEAMLTVENQLKAIRDKALEMNRKENADVLEAHLMMLKDPVFLEGFQKAVAHDHQTSEAAVQRVVEEQAAIFESMDNAYFRERAQDIKDIGNRVLNILLGIEAPDLSCLSKPTILVAHDIPPSMMASVDRDNLLGIVTEIGGKTSHTAILASNMGIPAVMGCEGIVERMIAYKTDELGWIDGTKGVFRTDLEAAEVADFKQKMALEKEIQASLERLRDVETHTKDGVHVQLVANVMGPDEVDAVLKVGGEGVGLYRTEFLFMDRNSLPTEEEQYQAYRKVVEGMKGNPVIIRTMDIGGDKEVDCLNLEEELNPFLGYRALRICLDRPALFQTQLRAILRASAHGKALIMFPMVSSLNEIRMAKDQVEIAKAQLREAGVAFDEQIAIGIMIEIPSAALIADLLIREVDFFSIGSNDLTQYTVAVDRMNQRIGNLYNCYHPAMLRLIKQVVDAAHNAGGSKFAGMCGEMAGDPKATLLLLGLGLQEFSVSPAKILRIRKLICEIDSSYAKQIANKALKLGSALEIEALLENALPEALKPYVQ